MYLRLSLQCVGGYVCTLSFEGARRAFSGFLLRTCFNLWIFMRLFMIAIGFILCPFVSLSLILFSLQADEIRRHRCWSIFERVPFAKITIFAQFSFLLCRSTVEWDRRRETINTLAERYIPSDEERDRALCASIDGSKRQKNGNKYLAVNSRHENEIQ